MLSQQEKKLLDKIAHLPRAHLEAVTLLKLEYPRNQLHCTKQSAYSTQIIITPLQHSLHFICSTFCIVEVIIKLDSKLIFQNQGHALYLKKYVSCTTLSVRFFLFEL